MNRRPLLALLLALAALGPSALLASAARADDEGDSHDGSDEDGGEDEAEDGDAGDTGASDGGEDKEDDHDDALRAVNANNAIPLKQVLLQFAREFDGTVVDVTMIRSTDVLRYRVKFIDPAGRVRRAYFDAVTGALVQ